MVGDGGMPAAPDTGKVFTATAPSAAASKSRLRLPGKRILIPAIAVFVVLVGAATYYFGYYANPSVIYSQSLKNTGKGYDNLVTYADQRSKIANQSYAGSGSYQFKTSGYSTDGKIGLQEGGGNSDLTFDVGLAAARLNADIRTIKSTGATPDIYMKFGGIQGLGTLMGAPELDPEFAKLNDNWIVIDHTLVDNLNAESGQSSSSSSPTQAQVIDEARAFGRVNQQYLFSTAKDKAVTKVVKKYGTETIDGHKTYHYQIVLQKDNVKKYILAQRDALKASKLNDWLDQNDYATSVYSSFTDAANSANEIKSSDTYDIWMDVSHRVLYKVRFSDKQNPADNYVDVGLNYKGGSDYPFFIAGQSKDGSSGSTTNYSFTTDLNTKTNATNLTFNVRQGGSDGGTASANFAFKPSATAITIDKPANAIPLSQVLSDLGLGDLFTSAASGADSAASSASTLQQQLQTANRLPAKSSSVSLQSAEKALLKSLLNR